ncbi:heme oxygenase-like domain-containing protein [Mycolicibacterium psychrotolerans]|nr:biliverdin-producing heme oxygenase [Mycolicibacterium psychrotolerans]
MSVEMSTKHRGGVTLAALRRATAADHASVDALIDLPRLVESGYYAAVLGGLIEAAETVEVTLPRISRALWREGLSPSDVSKRRAIDAESSFLDDLGGARPDCRHACGAEVEPLMADSPARATMLGLLYVYVGSALGGLHMLRIARTAPWWRGDRQQLLLRPYGDHLKDRWRTVLDVLERSNPDETGAAVEAARAGFDVHRRALVEHLSAGGHR